MEGNGITNKDMTINMGKKQAQIIKKPRILGKIIRNQFDQHRITNLLASNLCPLAIPTANPFLYFLFVRSRL
jgi:hypothetical protein